MIINLWAHRHLLFNRAWEDLRIRYTGSAIGVFWNILNPLAQIAIYTAVFAYIMPVAMPNMSRPAGFALYLCSGLLPWMAFVECITLGTNAFVTNASYLKKLPIPEQVFVAQNALSSTFGLSYFNVFAYRCFPTTASTFLLDLVFDNPNSPNVSGLSFSIGLALGCINVFFRDVSQMLAVTLQMWFWLTPIIYPADKLSQWMQPILRLNPAYSFIDAIHSSMLYGQVPPLWQWINMFCWMTGSFVVSYLILRRLRPEIRDLL